MCRLLPSMGWPPLVYLGLSPGLPGLAYPVRSSLPRESIGATRLGILSTGTAVEQVTEWKPGRVLGCTVMSQPRRWQKSALIVTSVPQLSGYVVTGATRGTFLPLRHGGTRLTLQAQIVLRIDPIAYGRPIARVAFHLNARRVLDIVKIETEGRVLNGRADASPR